MEGMKMDNKGVLVCGEIAEGKLAPITIELLGIGRKLADELGEELSALLMGSQAGGLGKEAIAYGADKVHVAEDSLLDSYNSDAYTQVAANLCSKVLPSVAWGVGWLWIARRYPLTRRLNFWSRPGPSSVATPTPRWYQSPPVLRWPL
jgi:electron transfer flavoprotein alpha subunit